MKLDFTWANDGKLHDYCIVCHGERVELRTVDGRAMYYCADCNKMYERRISMDPKLRWHLAEDGELWHEASGIFVRNPDGKFLLFELTKFPFAVTVPAGHVDAGEEPVAAAVRELEEEVGLRASGAPKHIASDDIVGDSCHRGSDAHVWHSFLVQLDRTPIVEVQQEGGRPVWLTLDEALRRDLTVPVRYVIERHKDALLA